MNAEFVFPAASIFVCKLSQQDACLGCILFITEEKKAFPHLFFFFCRDRVPGLRRLDGFALKSPGVIKSE